MAVQKPLVEVAGEIQTLQPGDTIDVGVTEISKTFTSAMVVGEAVYVDGNTSVDQAQANADGTSDCVGLVKGAAGAAATGTFIFHGVLTLTTGEWDAVAGTTGGLTANNKYYLSDAAPGQLLEEGNLVGITQGEYVVQVGIGMSTTEMMVNPLRRILR